MTFNLLDLVSDSKIATKKENKKKLHELLDKYGSVEEIERSGDLKDGYELDFARIDGALDEVLEERRMGYREPMSSNGDSLQSNEEQSNALLPDDEDFSLEGLALSDRQRKAIDKLDMANQLVIIKALREEQGIEKPKSKTETQEESEQDVLREKVDKANREIKVADNEQAGMKSDVRVEDKKKVVLDDDFYSQLAMDESSNNYKAYNSQGGGLGAIGKYQMRKPILQDLGYVDKKGNFTGKDGINSVDDFYKNHDVQEKSIQEMMNINYNYIKKLKLLDYIGTDVSGTVKDKKSQKREKISVNFEITLRGLLAAAHREGVGVLKNYLKSLKRGSDNYYLPRGELSAEDVSHYNNIEERLFYYEK